jgi:hypothetical protein
MKSPRAAAHPSTNDNWGFHMAKLKYHRRWLNKKFMYEKIGIALCIKSYFTRPYTSQGKGTIEN